MRNAVILGIVFLAINLVYALPTDYLVVEQGYPRVSPAGVARVGDPIAIDLLLKKQGVEPQEARLNLTIGIDNPWVEISYDSETKTFTQNRIEFQLPKGIKQVKIAMRGNAPQVKKLTRVDALVVRMYVYYDEDNKGYIDIPQARVTLDVTSSFITQTLTEISIAEQKLSQAQQLIDELTKLGVDTQSLKLRLESAKDSINIAKKEHERGSVDLAKSNAEKASLLLDDIIREAQKKKEENIKSRAMRKYIAIGAGIVVILIIIGFLLTRGREELG